jgi:hypothetical protein
MIGESRRLGAAHDLPDRLRTELTAAIAALDDIDRGVPGHIRALDAIRRARALITGQKP